MTVEQFNSKAQNERRLNIILTVKITTGTGRSNLNNANHRTQITNNLEVERFFKKSEDCHNLKRGSYRNHLSRAIQLVQRFIHGYKTTVCLLLVYARGLIF